MSVEQFDNQLSKAPLVVAEVWEPLVSFESRRDYRRLKFRPRSELKTWIAVCLFFRQVRLPITPQSGEAASEGLEPPYCM